MKSDTDGVFTAADLRCVYNGVMNDLLVMINS